jgi:hypothetical protein
MTIKIDDEFRDICKTIVEQYGKLGEASLVYSDDQYQALNFCGGWEPELRKFSFSYFAPDGGEYGFTLSLKEAEMVASGKKINPTLRYLKRAPPTAFDPKRDG